MAAINQGGALPKTRCVSCGSDESRISRHDNGKLVTRIADNQEIAGHVMCNWCYYTGAGFAYIYDAVISHCRAMGVKLEVWHTGGGCQNFAVEFTGQQYGLFGGLHGDLATDELGICVCDCDGDYEDEFSDNLNDEFPVPEVRTVESVANWVVSVVKEVLS